MKKYAPPKLATWFLEQMLDPAVAYAALGDFAERFQRIAQAKGIKRARFYYWSQIINIFPIFFKNSLLWSLEMLKNYFKTGVRYLSRHKGYSFINVLGLAVGMACCILLLLWIQDELSFDKYHEKSDQIYRITYAEEIGGAHDHYSLSPFAAAPAFAQELPEITTYTRIMSRTGLFIYKDKKFDEDGIYYTDPSIFGIFTYDFIAGDPENALATPGSLVLTETAARKIFGSRDPMGESVHLNNAGDLKVTGLIRDVPENSHFSFKYLLSWQSFPQENRDILEAWLSISGWSYVLLEEGADPQAVQEKFPPLVDHYTGEEARQYGIKLSFFLQKMTDIHLRSFLQEEISANGNILFVYVFSLIAIFILVIACINFMNLSTARSSGRGREVGLRKVFGAHRKRLIAQFITESLTLALLGLILALLLVGMILPAFNDLTGKDISLVHLNNIYFYLGLCGLILFAGLAAGSYPAFFLSAFQPIKVLHGKSRSSSKGSMLRSSLVTSQFALSVMLIISTLIVLGQVDYLKNRKLGFDKDQVLSLRIKGRGIRQQPDAFKVAVKQHQDIQEATYSNGVPGKVSWIMTILQEGKAESESFTFNVIRADYDFLETFGIELVAGRNFSRDFSSDQTGAFLINENAATKLGSSSEILQKKIGFSEEQMLPVVGIVQDFHFKSLKEKIAPIAILLRPGASPLLSLKMKSQNVPSVIAFVKKTWEEFEHDRDLEYFFVDENFDALYHSEEQLSKVISFFAGIAIFVACLGLFGLASFTAEQRTKEIGIRKVLGASAGNIVLQLSKGFVKWVLIANLVAWPVTYFIMNNYWMINFPFKLSLGIGLFLIAGGISLLIALLTVSYQTIKAALADPIKALKYE